MAGGGAQLPRRQKSTARRLFESLQKAGYQGAYDSDQRWVKVWKVTIRPSLHKAFISLSFRPGEAYQFDWSSETVILGGITTAIKVAHFRLTYSRRSFVRAYPRETQEMVFAAHQDAFLALEGVPERGIYDNPNITLYFGSTHDQIPSNPVCITISQTFSATCYVSLLK